ncbi:integrase arm-type DNA-binding domain-containing protein [Sphingomonas sp. CFBP 13603]|uniref:tyrosine-type recombinase/integrase n=1 Tax=Sphingomonas sp. CFBP 13603 TaxID=2774040 RepID=UPI0018676500|nr:integrase arm-type DNA-binding domain-containing protein [Sphingomonas sp. CFBP 13603]MBE2990904.1 integrase arm-type DNA-binding domain-containing protein [Sphingomonas sp. CFBP 13603]
MLTNAAVKAARSRATAYKLFDQGGLHLYVTPGNRKTFRIKFRFGGKEQLLTIGSVPEVSLDAARARCDQVRELLGRGEDPRTSTVAPVGKARAFENVARQWHTHMRRRWTEAHASDVLASLERDVFPAIGAMPIGAVTVPVILNALRVIEERGSLVTAGRVRQRISAVFAYAMAEDLVDQDPAAIVSRALTPPAPAQHHAALLEIEDARGLLAAAELVDVVLVVKRASRFLALTAVRFAAVRGARWNEIEDFDGAAPLWRVPAARMKLKAVKKLDAKNDHLVPLSHQAVALLREIRADMHPDDANLHDLIFDRGAGRMIGEKSIGALYDRAGFEGRHVPHGWRATFSTLMNEKSEGADRDVIERALAHTPKDKVRIAYDRSAQLQRLRDLFQEWADLLSPAATPAG